ncbi:MAG: bacterioferritin [Sedimentisphaerales bacterium]
MKGNKQLLKALNGLLADELAAVNQYMVHEAITENWGYEKLSKMLRARAITEMKHAETLIERILFLEGVPIVDKLSAIHIGPDVPKQFDNDLAAEMGAVHAYNAAIKLAQEVGDNATKEILDSILKQEDDHVDEIETQQDQIKQMGLPQYLNLQVG